MNGIFLDILSSSKFSIIFILISSKTSILGLIPNVIVSVKLLNLLGVINENISQLSASSEEVAATSEEGVNASKSAVNNLNRVTGELEQIVELSKKLQEVQ